MKRPKLQSTIINSCVIIIFEENVASWGHKAFSKYQNLTSVFFITQPDLTLSDFLPIEGLKDTKNFAATLN